MMMMLLVSFFFSCSCIQRYLHSFPTRRSSDLNEHQTSILLQDRASRDSFFTVLSSKSEHAVTLMIKRSEEHTSELQSLTNLVCRLLLEKKKKNKQRASKDSMNNRYIHRPTGRI